MALHLQVLKTGILHMGHLTCRHCSQIRTVPLQELLSIDDAVQAWLGALTPMLGQLRELDLNECTLSPTWCADMALLVYLAGPGSAESVSIVLCRLAATSR